jgi:methionyl-tRNA formyltransferase
VSARIVFMGTPAFAVPSLSAIIGQGHEVVGVYTRAPAPGGRRGLEPVKSPVHLAAETFNLPVFTVKSLKSFEAQTQFAALNADLAVVVAYGLLLPQAVLDAPRLGCLNLHASLLPRWRGAAPIQRAVMAGDSETGLMVMRMEAGLDTGPVGMVEKIALHPGMNAGQVHDILMPLGADLLVRAIAAITRGSLHFTPQAQNRITYAAKISKEECRIDWSKNATEVLNQIHGLAPQPGAFFEADWGFGLKRIKVLSASLAPKPNLHTRLVPGEALDGALTIACFEGAIQLGVVQMAGKSAMAREEFLRGIAFLPGTQCL